MKLQHTHTLKQQQQHGTSTKHSNWTITWNFDSFCWKSREQCHIYPGISKWSEGMGEWQVSAVGEGGGGREDDEMGWLAAAGAGRRWDGRGQAERPPRPWRQIALSPAPVLPRTARVNHLFTSLYLRSLPFIFMFTYTHTRSLTSSFAYIY